MPEDANHLPIGLFGSEMILDTEIYKGIFVK